MTEGIWIAIIGFILNAAVLISVVTWKLTRVEAAIREDIHRTKIEIHESKQEIDDDIKILRNEVGELGHALRAKITEVELWSRDTFLRRESFFEVIKSVNTQIQSLGDKLEARYLRIENKFDEVVKR